MSMIKIVAGVLGIVVLIVLICLCVAVIERKLESKKGTAMHEKRL